MKVRNSSFMYQSLGQVPSGIYALHVHPSDLHIFPGSVNIQNKKKEVKLLMSNKFQIFIQHLWGCPSRSLKPSSVVMCMKHTSLSYPKIRRHQIFFNDEVLVPKWTSQDTTECWSYLGIDLLLENNFLFFYIRNHSTFKVLYTWADE